MKNTRRPLFIYRKQFGVNPCSFLGIPYVLKILRIIDFWYFSYPILYIRARNSIRQRHILFFCFSPVLIYWELDSNKGSIHHTRIRRETAIQYLVYISDEKKESILDFFFSYR